jgi:Zn finger protein HypA/HybF involved in hydrogenase expression
MLKIVLRYADENHARLVTDCYVTLGDLASSEALEFHWGQISQGTVAERAALHFEVERTRLRCFACGEDCDYHPEHEVVHSRAFECPLCGSHEVELISGSDRIQLTTIDIEC